MQRDATIDEAAKWELAARLTYKAIADTPSLDPDKLVSMLNSAGNAIRNRNACVNKLLAGAPTGPGDPWAALDALHAQQRQQSPREPQDASGATAASASDQGGPDR